MIIAARGPRHLRDVRSGSSANIPTASGNVRFGSKADMCSAARHVRFTPIADMCDAKTNVRFVPIADIRATYSITSSAVACSVGGMSRPSALAVFRLIINSNFVGCSTGMSPGLVPRKILSTYPAARRNKSGKFGP